jgi:type II secretory pathway pseudopilin PulG
MEKRPEIVNRKPDPPLPLRYCTGGQVPRRTGNGPSSSGFTSIELIVVIICLGILTLAIGTRFNRNEMGSAVAADQLIADIRYVQLKAISIGIPQSISLRVDAADYGKYDLQGERKKLPSETTVTGTTNLTTNTMTFNTLGEPNIADDCIISLSGDSTIKVKVYNITGKAELSS